MTASKVNQINIASIVVTVIGIILEIIGGMTTDSGVGVNLILNPVTYVGMAVIAVGLIIAIVGYNHAEAAGADWRLACIALYFAEAAVVFAVVFMVMCIIWPLYNPANG